jgi:hypothetical protein
LPESDPDRASGASTSAFTIDARVDEFVDGFPTEFGEGFDDAAFDVGAAVEVESAVVIVERGVVVVAVGLAVIGGHSAGPGGFGALRSRHHAYKPPPTALKSTSHTDRRASVTRVPMRGDRTSLVSHGKT